MTERTYHRALAGLRTRGFIEPEYEGRAVFNALTDEGRQALLPTTANDCHGTDATTAAKSHTPRGGSGSACVSGSDHGDAL